MLIEKFGLRWNEAKLVETRRGPRQLRTAQPTTAFWGAWRSNKAQLQNEGVSCRKTRDDAWEICWWSGTAQQSNEVAATPLVTQASARVWSAEQQAIYQWFATGKGNLTVQARAGTGKTTTIEEAFKHATEQTMLYAVFNKKNQVEAVEKITDNRVEIKTLHSLGFQYITQVWRGVKPDNSVEIDRIEAVCPGIHEHEEACNPVERLVGFAKNMLLAPTLRNLEDLANDKGIFSSLEASEDGGYTVARLAEIALAALELAKTRDPQDRISFNDMVWLPVVKNWVNSKFDLVVVDEAQDMNVPQLEMAIRACNAGGRICIVGDDRQAIYGFRGAAQNGMRITQERLGASVLGLTTTYRCPKAVVAIAAEIVPDYKAAESAPDGTVDEISFDGLLDAACVGDAILSRLNAPLMSACLRLLSRGTPARIEGRDIGAQLVGMVRKLRAKSVPDFLRKLSAWGDKQKTRFAASRNAESKIAQVDDQVATLQAVAEGANNVSAIEAKLYSLFSDSDSNAKPSVVLSSVHKAKGLEWSRVFILRSTFKRKSDEEQNIFYVAVTRSKNRLTFVE